jgi:hypothetical protein
MLLEGKNAVVNGGELRRGVGGTVACPFAREGATVFRTGACTMEKAGATTESKDSGPRLLSGGNPPSLDNAKVAYGRGFTA